MPLKDAVNVGQLIKIKHFNINNLGKNFVKLKMNTTHGRFSFSFLSWCLGS